VPGRLLDHVQDDPAQVADLASRVTRMPALRRRRQRRRRHDGISALALIPVEAEHHVGRQAGGERFPALLLAGQPGPRQLARRASRHPLEPVTLGESEMLHQPERRPARRQDRRPQRILGQASDNRQHDRALRVKKCEQGALLNILRPRISHGQPPCSARFRLVIRCRPVDGPRGTQSIAAGRSATMPPQWA
jgi:hypothetical protein